MRQLRTGWSVAAVLSLAFVLLGATGAGAQSVDDSIEQLEAGEVVYAANCAGCHSLDGTGSDRGRPLIGIAGQEADRTIHFASIKDGKGNMPPFGDRLSDDEIDAATSYVRLTFVPEAAEATEADAAAATTEAGGVEELAVTGAPSSMLVIIGSSLLIAGWLFGQTRRRIGPYS